MKSVLLERGQKTIITHSELSRSCSSPSVLQVLAVTFDFETSCRLRLNFLLIKMQKTLHPAAAERFQSAQQLGEEFSAP